MSTTTASAPPAAVAAIEQTGEGTVTAAPRPRRSSRARRRRQLIALLYILPALAINLLVIGGAGVSSLYYAFTNWNGYTTPQFTGFANAIQLFNDADFWNAIGHNAIWMVIFLTVPLFLGLFGAFLLSRIKRGAMVFRVLYFIPYLIASVITAQIWKNLLDPQLGLAAGLDKIGIHWLDNVYFLGDSNLALYSVAFVDNWHFWGFLLVLFLAAMQGIDSSQLEAARIDGANAWQEFWHITLPGIRPTLTFAIMIIALWSLLAYDYPYVLTGGGPAGSSDLVSLLVNRDAFQNNEPGYGAFVALTMSLIGGVFLVISAILRRNEDEGQ